MLKGAVVSREEGKRTRTERSRCRGGARIFVRCSSGCCQTCSRCRPVRTFTSNNHPAKSPEWRFSPPQKQHGVSAADCPNAILEKPRIHPQELCLDICCCRLALIAAAPRGPHTGLGPGLVWLQVRTYRHFSAPVPRDGGRGGGGGQGGLEVSSAPRQVSRPVWASRPVKGLIRDVCFKRRISS